MRLLSSFIAILLMTQSAWALVIDTRLADPEQERAAQGLFHELRCIVCEGQSLAESDAVLAQQMRAEIRHQLSEGSSADDVKAYFVGHYGEQILQRPPVNGATLLLWAMPAILLLGGAWFLRPRRREGEVK